MPCLQETGNAAPVGQEGQCPLSRTGTGAKTARGRVEQPRIEGSVMGLCYGEEGYVTLSGMSLIYN